MPPRQGGAPLASVLGRWLASGGASSRRRGAVRSRWRLRDASGRVRLSDPGRRTSGTLRERQEPLHGWGSGYCERVGTLNLGIALAWGRRAPPTRRGRLVRSPGEAPPPLALALGAPYQSYRALVPRQLRTPSRSLGRRRPGAVPWHVLDLTSRGHHECCDPGRRSWPTASRAPSLCLLRAPSGPLLARRQARRDPTSLPRSTWRTWVGSPSCRRPLMQLREAARVGRRTALLRASAVTPGPWPRCRGPCVGTGALSLRGPSCVLRRLCMAWRNLRSWAPC